MRIAELKARLERLEELLLPPYPTDEVDDAPPLSTGQYL
jgi:hypothetical protein